MIKHLPQAITLLGLLFGLASIVWAPTQAYAGAIAIMMSALCDMLDGRVARWTGTQSAFGAQLDSLVDVVAFGVAPALLAYSWALSGLDWGSLDLGLGIAFAFAAGAALRLARFNLGAAAQAEGFSFQGMPTPMAALLIATLVMAQRETGWLVLRSPWLVGPMAVGIAVLMVSRVRFRSYKRFHTRAGRWIFFGSIAGGLSLLVAGGPGGTVLFSLLALYTVVGLVGTILQPGSTDSLRPAQAAARDGSGPPT